jgi:hypothetical protein
VDFALSKLARSILSVVADQPYRLLIAIALGGTLQAFATIAAAGSDNATVMALRELSIGYYIAFSFILIIIVTA